ncbi:endonuclease domain-containing protein [Streptomyces sudanensis]|uniref:endonuclease domain-containing protein n=1 Tax=Streptomyces sudanensis TaxID=436397 RepID=UPI0020CE98DE|nr:endonuclease domain-containing protein [Streptomyces sudanensis]
MAGAGAGGGSAARVPARSHRARRSPADGPGPRRPGGAPPCRARSAAVRRHVDLRHAAGKVPGVLCFNCNPAIGKPRGDRGVTGRAAAHVEGNSWKPTLEPQGVCRLPS